MEMMRTLCGVRVGNMKDPNPETRGLVDFRDLPLREMGPQDVKIKVAYCAICGSDPHAVAGCFGQPQGDTTPIGLGHEISGVIVELGPEAHHKGLKVGDRVGGNFIRQCGGCWNCASGKQQFCTNVTGGSPGMAQYIIWHEDQVYKLPDSVSLKEGCLLEPLSIVIRMMDKCNVKCGNTVCVCGGGPIGLLAIQCLSMYGATNLTLLEPLADRRELAKTLGAVHTIDSINEDVIARANEITEGRGFDIVLDCSGAKAAAPLLPEICGNGGTLIYGAMYPNDYNMPFNIAKYCYFKELTISGVFVAPYAFPRAVNMLPRLNLKCLTDTVFDLDDGVAAYAEHLTGKHPTVIVKCNPDLE